MELAFETPDPCMFLTGNPCRRTFSFAARRPNGWIGRYPFEAGGFGGGIISSRFRQEGGSAPTTRAIA